MNICAELDKMILGMKAEKLKPERIIMGREYCVQWLSEMARQGEFEFHPGAKKYDFTYKGIPLTVCYSGILEVVPNARQIV